MEVVSTNIDCSVIASVFNEEECLMKFYESLSNILFPLQIRYEIIFY